MKRKMIAEDAIQLDVLVKDWEEAVRICGEILVEKGKVETNYIEAMIRSIKELGPYILIAPGVAMPHARPEDGVKEEGICVVILKNEVAFEQGKEVKVLIGLAAVDKDSHIELLKKIAEVISQEESMERLKNAKVQKEVLELFNGGE